MSFRTSPPPRRRGVGALMASWSGRADESGVRVGAAGGLASVVFIDELASLVNLECFEVQEELHALGLVRYPVEDQVLLGGQQTGERVEVIYGARRYRRILQLPLGENHPQSGGDQRLPGDVEIDPFQF